MHVLTKRLLQLGIAAAMVMTFSLLGQQSTALAQDGKALYAAKGCAACHGPTGNQPIQPAYPKLSGQNADYVVAQLKAFKSQERKGGQAPLMWAMAAQLKDAEMVAIAKYLQTAK